MRVENDEIARFAGETKYFQRGESRNEAINRIAAALSDSEEHRRSFKQILKLTRFIPAGRVMAAAGSTRRVTAYNCFVSGTIEDSMGGIHRALGDALETMRMGGGIGYDFSTLRPSGDLIRSLESHSSGPVGDSNRSAGFMDLFDSGCSVISSAGHRRGAQMGVLRIDHPDILYFIRAKKDTGRLKNFNISVGVTDDFMEALLNGDEMYSLRFQGRHYQWVNPQALWDEIMRSTWDWAEPGVLFLDTMNNKNNLRYCETIAATNPCGEQPLPPYGACLLGSFNLTSYLTGDPHHLNNLYFNYEQLIYDIPHVVRAMDNVIDRTVYPLKQQELEAKNKRRMGLGITGLANAAEALGLPYGSPEMLAFTKEVLSVIAYGSYSSSIALAVEKGSFPLFDADKFLEDGTFASRLPDNLKNLIRNFGIRNSHLTSIAPTGTISLYAGNVSSGCEPPWQIKPYWRNAYAPDGSIRRFYISDWLYEKTGIVGRSAQDIGVKEHLDVLLTCSNLVDSSVSKTVNVGPHVTFREFSDIYIDAWRGGASGCTTFRTGGKLGGIFESNGETNDSTLVADGAACHIDEQGNRTCD